MLSSMAEKRTTRLGIFDTVVEADRAVHNLLEAGFTKKEIGVLCSMKSLKSFFPDIAEPPLAKVHESQTITAGGAVGASVGGLALAVLAATTGGVGLLAAGAILVGGGALAGIFAGAIYGIEKAKGDYYDLALKQGKILVVVDLQGQEDPAKLDQAEHLLAKAGATEVQAVGGYP